MKPTRFLTALLLLAISSIACQAQIKIRNLSLIDPDQKIIYRKWINRIEISGFSDSTGVRVECDNAMSFVMDNDRIYFEMFPDGSEFSFIRVYRGENLLVSSMFKNHNLGREICYFGEKPMELVPLDVILNDPEVKWKFKGNLYLEINSKVSEFTLLIQSEFGDDQKQFNVQGSELTQEILDYLSAIKGRKSVIIHSVKARQIFCRQYINIDNQIIVM